MIIKTHILIYDRSHFSLQAILLEKPTHTFHEGMGFLHLFENIRYFFAFACGKSGYLNGWVSYDKSKMKKLPTRLNNIELLICLTFFISISSKDVTHFQHVFFFPSVEHKTQGRSSYLYSLKWLYLRLWLYVSAQKPPQKRDPSI